MDNHKGATVLVAYIGPHEAVEVPALRRTVRRYEEVNISDNRLARLFVSQGWAELEEESI